MMHSHAAVCQGEKEKREKEKNIRKLPQLCWDYYVAPSRHVGQDEGS
jgi:hypothetical protein